MTERNPFVAITAITGGILLSIIIVFLVFAREVMAVVMPTIVWGLVALSAFMGFFAAIKRAGKK